MNIRDLKYLVAVAETQHFGKAADRCFVSQPTLSMQLKKLEEELNVQLFERTSKQVLVTDIGKQLVEKARRVLSEIDELKQIAAMSQDPFSGNIRIGIIPTMGPYLLPQLMSAVSKKYPNLSLVLYEDKTEVITEKLKQGELDAVILALPIDCEGVVTQELFTEDFYLAVPKSHPLSKKKQASITDLKDQNLLLLGEGHCFRDQALEACRFSGAQMKSGFQATSLETIRNMVVADAGITLFPKMMVDALPDDKDLVIVPFEVPAPSRRIGMLWRETSPAAVASKALADLLRLC
ncbi:MAG: LysR family transcriptional regulator [Coxiellaceae bacterium]|nr:LysR family transcriptional regulator [Coxiellaceae bacterium]